MGAGYEDFSFKLRDSDNHGSPPCHNVLRTAARRHNRDIRCASAGRQASVAAIAPFDYQADGTLRIGAHHGSKTRQLDRQQLGTGARHSY